MKVSFIRIFQFKYESYISYEYVLQNKIEEYSIRRKSDCVEAMDNGQSLPEVSYLTVLRKQKFSSGNDHYHTDYLPFFGVFPQIVAALSSQKDFIVAF